MWAHIISTILGLWLMAAPAVLRYDRLAADNDHIVGPLAAAFAAVAMTEITRPVRRVNVLCGGWLLAAPWVLHAPAAAIVNDMIVGILLIGLSFVAGRVNGKYGGGWSTVWRSQRST